MLTVFHAVLPIFAVIAAGHVLKRTGMPGDAFWAPAERLVYWVLFPALLVVSLANRPVDPGLLPMALAMAAASASIGILLLLARPLVRIPGPAFTSVVQGATRFNTYIGFSLAAALYGSQGIALLTLPVAILLPVGNVISIWALSRYGTAEPLSPGRMLFEIARNPFVAAVAAGIALNLAGVGVPAPLDRFMEIIGGASLPLGLLAVGAGLRLDVIGRGRGPIALACAIKLAAVPAATWALCHWLGIDGPALVLAVVFSGLAAAPACYVMARIMGGDAELMAGIVTMQTLVSLFSITAILLLLL
jgi:malonate transporter